MNEPPSSGEERIGFNEAAFRAVNEGINAGRGLRGTGDSVGFLCECGRLGCNTVIELTVGQYEALRRHPRRFATMPGHEFPEEETILERHPGYQVVEKLDAAASVAEATDPRD